MKSEGTSSKPAPISDAELAAILENSPWAKMEREVAQFPDIFDSEEAA